MIHCNVSYIINASDIIINNLSTIVLNVNLILA